MLIIGNLEITEDWGQRGTFIPRAHPFKYLTTCYVPSVNLGTRERTEDQIYKVLSLVQFIFQPGVGEIRQVNDSVNK